jgi:hypothetical protein
MSRPVDDVTYLGRDSARRSISGYLALFPDPALRVDDQLTEGDKVASPWTLTGTHRSRRVELHGIVLSCVRDGQIIEDWAKSCRAAPFACTPTRVSTRCPARSTTSAS